MTNLRRAAGFVIAVLFRAIPRERRFAAAIVVARWLEPLIRRTRGYAERVKLKTDDLRETSLDLLLMMLTRHGSVFQPLLQLRGAEHLPAPASGPILVVSPHTMLSVLFLRHLEDAGYAPFVIAEYPRLRIPGTVTPARVLCESPALLFKVRSLLGQGRTVAAMIDRDRAERRHASVQTPASSLFISEACLQLAVRQRARIVFLATRMDDESGVVCQLGSPERRCGNIDTLIGEFAAFVEGSERIGRVRRSDRLHNARRAAR